MDREKPRQKRKWRFPKVSIRTFIDDKRYLGIGDTTYPRVKDICEQIVEGKYVEAVEVAGIGAGKSYSAEILACYYTYHLLCLRNPREFYNLSQDKPITIMNMGINSTQAWEVVFTGIKSLIEKSPFFSELEPRILGTSIRFEKEGVLLMSGNSKSTTPLGYNVFFSVLDEAAFYMDNDNKSVAEEIYNSLQRRIVSRFGYDGMIAMISSPRYVEDFIMKKLGESKLVDNIYGIQLPTWKVKDAANFDLTENNVFYFNPATNNIFEGEGEPVGIIDYVVSKGFNSRANYWQIPGEFKQSFIVNPEKAKRDFGATPSLTLEGFMPHPEIVATAFNQDLPDPVSADGKYHLNREPLRVDYYMHIDLAKNKNGGGDKGALCMAHFDGWENNEQGEKRKKVYVDLLEQLEADPILNEIDYEKVRQKIYALKEMGYNIKLVTFDQFQCLRAGTKIPVIQFDKNQCIDYNESITNNYTDMIKGTSLAMLKGVDKNIEDIKPGEYVYSINKKGAIGFGKVLNVWSSGKKKIYRVWLDNNKYIDCSGNHPFMLRDGTYKHADKLKAGDSLMPLYRKTGDKSLPDYEMVMHPNGRWEFTHRAIMRQKKEISRGKVIHHKDFCKTNNEPTNLESLSISDHNSKHNVASAKNLIKAREALQNNPEALARKNKALSETSKRNWATNPSKFKKALAIGNKARWSKLEEHEKISSLISERNKVVKARLGSPTSEQARKNLSLANKLKWQSPEYRLKMANRKMRGKNKPKVINHKVLKVEVLGIEDEVWDIEVEGTHNFATSAGVFVHNSVDSQQILKKKGIRTDLLSVDRTTEPYDSLKEVIYDKRITIHKQKKCFDELCALELVKGKKVDHPPMGCFTGDTRVALLDGRNLSFEEIYKEFGKDKFWVYSNKNGNIVPGVAKNCRITKRTSELVEILLDNYQVIQCTPEHPFQLLNGSYKEAKDLTREDSLMPLYRSIAFKGGWLEYERIWNPATNERLLTHKRVSEYIFGKKKVFGKIIHHKDENKMNNAPANLIPLNLSEHSKYHTTKRHKEDSFYTEKVVKALHKGYDKFLERKNDKIRTQRTSRQVNHRILYVKPIIKEADVWDIEVEDTNNFALTSGVFVHNSKDLSDALCGAVYNVLTNTSSSDFGIIQGNISSAGVNKTEAENKVDYYKKLEEMNNKGLFI